MLLFAGDDRLQARLVLGDCRCGFIAMPMQFTCKHVGLCQREARPFSGDERRTRRSVADQCKADSSWKCNALATVLSCSWLRPESTPEQRFEVVFASPVSCAGEC